MGGNEYKIYKRNLFFLPTHVFMHRGMLWEKKLYLNNFKLRNISNIKYASRGQKIRWRYTTAHHIHLCLFSTDMLSVPVVHCTTMVCARQNNVMWIVVHTIVQFWSTWLQSKQDTRCISVQSSVIPSSSFSGTVLRSIHPSCQQQWVDSTHIHRGRFWKLLEDLQIFTTWFFLPFIQ